MLTILAVDTSTSLASVALLRNGESRSRESHGVQTHSQVILPMVQALLAEAGISLAQCNAIAFGAGPGSFTGVRTACGIAQGLGYGAGLPVVPVMTLEAMAEACRDVTGADDVLPVLDAAMGEVYWAHCQYVNGWKWMIAPTLSSPTAVNVQGGARACGNGLSAYASAFTGKAFMQNPLPEIFPHAVQIARLGMETFKQGGAVSAHEAQPFYLRNKVAFTTAERAEKAAQQLAKVCG